MDYRILGPLEVHDGGRPLALGGDKQRSLLAILLLRRNEVVLADRLIDDLWGEAPPAHAARTLQVHVSRLRKALTSNGGASALSGDPSPSSDNGLLLTRGHGYLLRVAPGELDLDRFRKLVEQGQDALAGGDPERAARVLREALELWRGPPLADFTYETFAQASIAQLEELQLGVVEDRVEADLALGRDRELVGELRDLVGRHPLRERLRGQLMLALYRSGRQAEALEAYQEFRRALSEQLGLEPGPGLRQLELAILARDPTLEPPAGTRARTEAAEGSPALSVRPAAHRRRVRLAVGGSALVAVAVGVVVTASVRGGAAAPSVVAANAVGAIDPSGGTIRAVVPLGTSPSVVASGDGAVWVANYNAGTVSRIDPATRAVVQTISTGSTPSGIAVGAGVVWVANNYGETVSRIDPAVNRVVQTIPVGNGPSGVAVGDGSVWVTNSSDGTLSRIDAVTAAVVKTIPLGGGATDVAAGLGAVWVSDAAGGRVVRVDPQTDQVTQVINVGSGPGAITVGYGSVWVANSLDGTVSRIDPQTNNVTATIPVGDGPNAVAAGREAVWVANQYAGTVSAIDPRTSAVVRSIAIGNSPQGLAIAGGWVWIGAQARTSGHRGGTLTELKQTPVGTADPAVALYAVGLLELTNDGLTAYKRIGGAASTQVVPDLAVSLPSPADGGRTYTFQLRRGVRYSNGEPVRPEDFRRALARDLTVGPSPAYGSYFADVVGGAACAAHPKRCDLSRGVVTNDAADTVTFHLVAPNPEFLARLTLSDAFAVPAGAPYHDIGDHPLPATGPYEFASYTPHEIKLVRNPYFRVWSPAARPDGYPSQIDIRIGASPSAELTAVERGSADYTFDGPPAGRMREVRTRFASRLYVNPNILNNMLFLNTRVAPFTDIRVRRALNYAVDRAEVARLLGQASQPTCQALPPYIPGYRRYCPYTVDPNAAGVWHAPDVAEAKRLIAASHTRGTPITIWNLGTYQSDYTTVGRYLASLLDQLGYPTRVKDYANDPNAPGRFNDSRTKAQAGLAFVLPVYLSASQIIEASFGCQSFVPASTGSGNTSEFCDHRLDAQISSALSAESNNSANAGALWAQADRTLTDDAPFVALTTPRTIDFVSKRVGNYEYNYQQGVLIDQLWVR